MKRLLAKVGLPTAIGLYIDDQTVTLSQVASTPFGPVEIAGFSEDAEPNELPVVLTRLLTPLLGKRRFRRIPVALGLPAGRTCLLTRPIQSASSDPSSEVLLHEALRSSKISINNMAVDVVKTQPDKRPVAAILSCEKKYLTELLGRLEQCDLRPLRAEPEPCALLRAAVGEHRAPRGAKIVVRLFLSETQALAILAVANQPIVWRFTGLERGDEAAAIVSVSRCVQMVSKDCGIESSPDAIILHGRPALARLLDVDWVEGQLSAPVQWHDGPALDNSRVAFGLALGCLTDTRRTFDLSRSLKPRASIWEVFPWREAIAQCAMLGLMALFLFDRSESLNRDYEAVRLQNSQRADITAMKDAELQKMKTDLEQKVAAVEDYLDTRINWTSYERDLSKCLPPEVYLASFAGLCELKTSGKKRGGAKPKKSLVLQGAAAITKEGSV
ncbi:MAG: hypothetical protein HQ582_21125, partial [Planctomycetes bacterium]|nr:hypothetical protein [Planctomycetota bacterium]